MHLIRGQNVYFFKDMASSVAFTLSAASVHSTCVHAYVLVVRGGDIRVCPNNLELNRGERNYRIVRTSIYGRVGG